MIRHAYTCVGIHAVSWGEVGQVERTAVMNRLGDELPSVPAAAGKGFQLSHISRGRHKLPARLRRLDLVLSATDANRATLPVKGG